MFNTWAHWHSWLFSGRSDWPDRKKCHSFPTWCARPIILSCTPWLWSEHVSVAPLGCPESIFSRWISPGKPASLALHLTFHHLSSRLGCLIQAVYLVTVLQVLRLQDCWGAINIHYDLITPSLPIIFVINPNFLYAAVNRKRRGNKLSIKSKPKMF